MDVLYVLHLLHLLKLLELLNLLNVKMEQSSQCAISLSSNDHFLSFDLSIMLPVKERSIKHLGKCKNHLVSTFLSEVNVYLVPVRVSL